MDRFVGKKLSLNAIAYHRKLLWHMERAPVIAIWKSRIRKMPLFHVLYLGGSESKEKSPSSLVLPETFQCNDIKTKNPQQVSDQFCQAVLCPSTSTCNLPNCIIHNKTYPRSVDFGGHDSLFLLTCRENVEK